MHPQPWLSVLIPAFNTEDYLSECVNSILSQQNAGVEVILYNDGSTDGTHDICLRFEQDNPDRVKYINGGENKGIAVSRNRLLDHASGKYIWFIDSDDFALPDSLEQLQKVASTSDPELIICDYRRNNDDYGKSFDGTGGRLIENTDSLIAGFFKCRKVYCWQKIIKKEVFARNPKFPAGQIFEDVYVIPQLIFSVASYYYLAKPCISYRIRPGSIMAAISRNKGAFSVKKHLDMISALEQIPRVMSTYKDLDSKTKFWISNFVAREYIKTSRRYNRRKYDVEHDLPYFRAAFEACSPMGFKRLAVSYFLKGKFILFFKMCRALRGA